MSHATRILIALATLIAAGCSGGSGSTGDNVAPPQDVALGRDDYALQLAEWLCDDLAACCDGTQQSFDRDACVAVKRNAELHRVASEESHSGRGFDEAMAATCVARLQETPADCGSERRVKECFRTYDGLREIGEECVAKIQCRGSLRGDVACIEGRCAPRLAAGEACQDLPTGSIGGCDVCRPEASCREADDGNHYCYQFARRRGVEGDPCVKQFSPPADPEAVAIVASCEREDGLYCSSDGVCTRFVPTGGLCSLSLECGPGARCENGICTAGGSVGETCRSSFNACGPELYCLWTDFVCTDPGPGAQPCKRYDLVEGQCAVPAGEGEACGDFVRCAQGLSCATSGASAGRCVTEENTLCTSGLERLTRQSR